jgi:hypothetical protein
VDSRVAQRMTAHVTALAVEHGITLTWVRSWRLAEAFPEERTAYVPVIRRPRDYLFALHELGHTADPLAVELLHDTTQRGAIVCESAAWAWVSEVAKPALLRHVRAEDWNAVAYAWRTYLAEGWRRDRRVPRGSG